MPGFSTAWGPGSYNRMAPLTPPEYDTTYSHRMGDQAFYGQHTSQFRNDGYKQYNQSSAVSAYQPYHGSTGNPLAVPTYDYAQGASYAPRIPSTRTYAPDVSATILPPIRGQDAIDPYAHYSSTNPLFVPKPKEEKATGGVAAHLDYDIPTMSDFVAEVSQGMLDLFLSLPRLSDIDFVRSINPNTRVDAQYRKYVTQILTSTRLPSSTIMLGLFYLANRMKILSARGADIRSRDVIYRMLTTCLLLGSKFLDDNTFQNRSWAEVSNINVKELNTMELDWLQDFDWCIHSRMYDQHEGFYVWREHWLSYAKETEIRKIKEAHKLAPIDTTLARRSVHKPMMSPEGPIPAQYQRKAQYDAQWVSPLISEPSPPSAAYSGPATPEYYNSATWGHGHPAAYSSQPWTSHGTTPGYISARSQPAYQQKPSFMQHYGPGVWNGHGHGCGCTMYGKCKDHYFLAANHYNMQPVAC